MSAAARAAVSGLALAAVAGTAVAQPAVTAAVAPPPRHALWVALPSLDGAAGVEVGGERGLGRRRGVVLALSARRTAAGDYDAVRLGVAAEYRWYWRGDARWNQIAGLDRTGWFAGGRADLASSRLHQGERDLGRVVIGGLRAELGYRLTPWRGLAVTALVGAGAAVEGDSGGRLPVQGHAVLGFGLDLGWMF